METDQRVMEAINHVKTETVNVIKRTTWVHLSLKVATN